MGVLLRRVLIGGHIGAVGVDAERAVATVVDHALHPELGCTIHGGEGADEEVAVEGVEIVLPEVGAVPHVGNEVVVAPRAHAAEDVVLGEACPSVRDTAVGGGGAVPVGAPGHIDDIVEEGQVCLAEVGGLGGPVVHLHIDVRVDVAVPGCLAEIVPDALKVVGHIDAERAAYLKVASVGEVELLEEQCLGLAACGVGGGVVAVDELVGGQTAGCRTQLQRDAPHIAAEGCLMVAEQGCPAFVGCRSEAALRLCCHVGIGSLARGIGVVVVGEG